MSHHFRTQSKMPKYKAVNPFNQLALDHLCELSKKSRYSTSDHYPRLFVKSMQSLSKCPLEIKTFKDATALSGVGNFIAREIMNALKDQIQGENNTDNEIANNKKRNDEKNEFSSKKASKRIHPPSSNTRKKTQSNLGAQKTTQTMNDTRNTSNRNAHQMKKATNMKGAQKSIITKSDVTQSMRKLNSCSKANAVEHGSKTQNSQRIRATPKEMAYIRSTNESIGILTKLHLYNNWKVILLLDCREHHSNSVQAKLLQYGIDCEQRQLPVGDVLWIARGEYSQNLSHSDCSSSNNDVLLPDHIEIVLGTIIERKSLSDLASSLFGTRFEEQRLRLKHSHSTFDCENQVIFLVEGSNINEVGNCPASTLRYAMMSTRIHMGFQVIRTKNLEDTCRMFQRIHLRIMQRSFSKEIKCWREQFVINNSNKKRKDKKIRRNTFDFGPDTFKTTPNIPFARTRHYLYNEMKSKVEFDRERGTKSIYAIFRAQLKQVDSMSNKKVEAISRFYKTPRALMIGYESCSTEDACNKMVENIQLGNKIERASRVGPKSSNELSCVYTKGGDVKRWISGSDSTMSVSPKCIKEMNAKVNTTQSIDSLKNNNADFSGTFDFETPKQSNKTNLNDQSIERNLSEHKSVMSNFEQEIQVFDFDQSPSHTLKNIASSELESHDKMKQVEDRKSFDSVDLVFHSHIERNACVRSTFEKDDKPETLDLTQPSSDEENNEEIHSLKSSKDFYKAKKQKLFENESSSYNSSVQDDDKKGVHEILLDNNQTFVQSPLITTSRPSNTTNNPEIIELD